MRRSRMLRRNSMNARNPIALHARRRRSRQQQSLVSDLLQGKGRVRKTGRQTGKTGGGIIMDVGTGIALLIAFLAVVVLIIRGQSPIIMLLLLAIVWAVIAGIGVDDIQKKIL